MSLLKKISKKLIEINIDFLISLKSGIVFNHLRKTRLKQLISNVTAEIKPGIVWQNAQIPDKIDGFEDLSFLFLSSILNRGIARLNLNEAALLYRLVMSIPNAKVVEIGRRMGGSTFLLSSAVGNEGSLTSIDIDPMCDSGLSEALNNCGLSDRVHLITGDANIIEIDDKLDLIFIDGDHSYEGAKKDHFRWGRKVKPGGYIAHHDMSKTGEFAIQHSALKKLRDDILKHQCGTLELYTEADSLCIFRRINDQWEDF